MDIQYILKIIPVLLKASLKTLELTVVSVSVGSLLGVLFALIKLQKNKLLQD